MNTKEKILRTIRSNECLAGIELKDFRMRHMNEDLDLGYFELPRKTEEQVRRNAAT